MRILASLFLAGSIAFASGITYTSHIVKTDIKQIKVPFLFKTTTLDNIQNVSISHDDKKVIVATNHKVKIFDTKEEELIKTLHFNDNILKIQFSKDNKQIFILTDKVFYIYDNYSYKEIAQINMLSNYSDEYFEDFFIRGNFLGIIEQYNYYGDNWKHSNDYSKIRIFDLKTGKEIKKFKVNDLVYYGDFSSNLKKIALTSNSRNYSPMIYIYNLDGELLHTLPRLGKYYQIKWLNKRDIVVKSTNRGYIFDIKTSKIVATIKTKNNIADIKILDKNHIATFIYNYKMKIFDINKKGFLNKEYLFKGESEKDAMNNIDLSDDRKFLVVGYNSRNMKFFKTAGIFKDFIKENSNKHNTVLYKAKNIKEKVVPKVVEQKPKVIIKKEVVEKVIVKKVLEKENKKPTLTIYASQTDGEAPLTVNFKFLADDEDGKIVSYYINFAGKEIIHKGNPTKSFNYTFTIPGKYKIMVAVKDNKGAITTKQITINVKPRHEETFEEYKRSLMEE